MRAVSACGRVGGRFELELLGPVPPVLAEPESATRALSSLLCHSGRTTSWSAPVRLQAYAVPDAVEICISAGDSCASEEEIRAFDAADAERAARIAELFGEDVERAHESLRRHGSRLELLDCQGAGRTFRFRLVEPRGFSSTNTVQV
jgi:hypothetical protein